MLAWDALEIGYGRQAIARLPATYVAEGEFICLLGRNGQGKSTLLRTLGGFLAPVAGRVLLAGRPVASYASSERARRIAVVLTERLRASALSVTELVEMGRQPYTGWMGKLGREDHRVVAMALDQVDAGHLARRTLDSLSDGERQRVMIARALAQQPALMLLDEVTAFLDLPSRVTIIDALRRIAREQRVAIVLSSHDLDLSLQTADRLWLLPGGGRFIDGAPEDVALSGAIGEAFDQRNLRFSLDSGRFETPSGQGRRVHVTAGAAAAAWMQRALQRRGYRAVADPAHADHRVLQAQDGRWQLDGAVTTGSIAQLLSALDTGTPA